MRLYRLFNGTLGAPASGLLFLREDDARRYRAWVVWPYADEGLWPLPDGGALPLEELDLRVEPLDLPVAVERPLSLVVEARGGRAGAAPLLPGDCFDPAMWRVFGSEDMAHPERGPALRRALVTLEGGL